MKIAPLIQNLIPYVAGKPIEETKREFGLNEVVKLASNENPLGPSPRALKAIQGALNDLHRYPDPNATALKQKMAAHLGYPTDWMTFGNGSDEMIDLLLRVFCSQGGRVLMFEKSFAAYKIAAHATAVEVDEVPLATGFRMDLDDLAAKFNPMQHRLIFLVNPNNPTGSYVQPSEIRRLLDRIGPSTDTLVVLDEAYFEFVQDYQNKDSLRFLRAYPNLIVLRTMSKAYGLAGIRIGTLIAQPKIVDWLNRTRKPFNVNSLAQVAAMAALDDPGHVRQVVELTNEGKRYVSDELKKLGLPFIPSEANFIMFETPCDSDVVFQALLRRGVILRPLKNYGLKHHLRFSVGTAAENQAAIHALREVLRDLKAAPVVRGSP